MKILSIESSCDETAAAVIEDGRTVLSGVVASQIEIHRRYGGVVPEIASRAHTESIVSVTDEALNNAGISMKDIDAVAVTNRPGLIGALLVGVSFAKAAAFANNKPLIPVHHIRGHIAANYIASPELKPPFLALVVSGGHTMLVKVLDYTRFEILGRTRDDAAGEAFDKVARLLGLPYPGGIELDKLADTGNGKGIKLPKAEVEGCPLDMSFSGIKTASINIVHNLEQKDEQIPRADIAAAFRSCVVETLVLRLIRAMEESGFQTVVLAGGVAANSLLRKRAAEECRKRGGTIYIPPLNLCGDNAAMIGCQGYYEYLAGNTADMSLNAYATASIEQI